MQRERPLSRSISYVYFLVTFFLFAFVGMNAGFSTDLKILYIPGDKNFLHFLFLMFIIFSTIVVKKGILKIDIITKLLILKCLFDFFFTFVINHVSFEYHFYTFFCTNIGLLCYFVVLNLDVDIKKVINLYRAFLIVLSVQVSYVYISSGFDFTDISYKVSMRIPFASSNVIAGVLVAGILITLVNDATFIKKLIYYVIYGSALIFTGSRGGMLLLFLLLDFFCLKKVHDLKNRVLKVSFYMLLIGINLFVVYYVMNNNLLITFFSGYKGYATFNDFSSRRVEVWQYAFSEFLKSPIWGRGIYYDQTNFIGSTGMHNIILELLAGSGIIGTTLYLSALGHCVRKIKLYKVRMLDRNQIMIIVLVTTFLLNSLFEVVYFNYIYDVIFWSYLGALMKSIYAKNKEVLE